MLVDTLPKVSKEVDQLWYNTKPQDATSLATLWA